MEYILTCLNNNLAKYKPREKTWGGEWKYWSKWKWPEQIHDILVAAVVLHVLHSRRKISSLLVAGPLDGVYTKGRLVVKSRNSTHNGTVSIFVQSTTILSSKHNNNNNNELL